MVSELPPRCPDCNRRLKRPVDTDDLDDALWMHRIVGDCTAVDKPQGRKGPRTGKGMGAALNDRYHQE